MIDLLDGAADGLYKYRDLLEAAKRASEQALSSKGDLIKANLDELESSAGDALNQMDMLTDELRNLES